MRQAQLRQRDAATGASRAVARRTPLAASAPPARRLVAACRRGAAAAAAAIVPSLAAPQQPRSRAVTMRATAAPATRGAPQLGARLGPAYDAASNMPDWHKGRRAGVILHPTSLPGPYGIGELGSEAFAFLDWAAAAGLQCWQVLPLVPPDPEYFSPYSGLDANCGNPMLISLDALITEGLLEPADAPAGLKADGDVDFAAVAAAKGPLLSKAARALLSDARFGALRECMSAFRAENPWIEESALFDALRRVPELEGKEWWAWPEPLKLRDAAALKKARAAHAAEIDEFVAVQFLFDRQWKAVKVGARARGAHTITAYILRIQRVHARRAFVAAWAHHGATPALS
jgi:4-alpha-glucanotransferase